MPDYTLKNGETTLDVRLDRVPFFDRRSLDFLIRDLLNEDQKQTLTTKLWDAPSGTPVLDQGQEGACTGFGTTNELLWNPVPVPGLDGTFAREKIYWVAQETDPWPGGSYPGAEPQYEGTAVLYAIRAAADLGYYTEYRWAKSESEMALGVSHLGPAIIGINWYKNMFTPDTRDFVHPTGSLAGGHCILVTGIDVEGGFYTLHNSWGPTWGDNGNCKIKRADMAKLLREQGECCIITGRALPAHSMAEAAAVSPSNA
jgi:papain like protease